MKNNHGQTIIEALGGTVVVTFAFLFLLKPAACWVERLWLENCAHNALRCELRGHAGANCRHELQVCGDHLPWGAIQNVQLNSQINQRQKKAAHVHLKWCTQKGESPCSQNNQVSIQMQLRESRITAMSWSDGLRSRPLF